MRYVLALCLLLPGLAAAEIYKCVSETGQTTYADQPCGPQAEEFHVREYQQPPQTLNSGARARQSLRNTQRFINQQRVEREIRESWRLIEDYRRQMESELAGLRRSQRISSNNLAGATRDVSIAQEMKAVTQKYQALIAIEQSELDRLTQVRLQVLN